MSVYDALFPPDALLLFFVVGNICLFAPDNTSNPTCSHMLHTNTCCCLHTYLLNGKDGVRPFLSVAGGSITCQSITGESSVQPQINLKMEGASASLQSVKLEIVQRLQRHFMLAGLKVEWDD